MLPTPPSPGAIFFDFDGTLADSSMDLLAPIQLMRQSRGLPPLPEQLLSQVVHQGSRGLIKYGLGAAPDSEDFPALRDEFFSLYEKQMLVHTHLYPGIPSLLNALDQRRVQWGIISNKPERFLKKIAEEIGLAERAVCLVGGDTTGFAKPHPAPLLHAANLSRARPQSCVYIGNDVTDIEAGLAAGMYTIAAIYDIPSDATPETWGSHAIVQHPSEYLDALGRTGVSPRQKLRLTPPTAKASKENTLFYTRCSEDFSVAPQLRPQDMQAVASAGFLSVINHRPDAEGGSEHPRSEDIEKAASSLKLTYVHQPVCSGQLTEEDAARLKELLCSLPKPIMAFCRTGARSSALFSLAKTL